MLSKFKSNKNIKEKAIEQQTLHFIDEKKNILLLSKP